VYFLEGEAALVDVRPHQDRDVFESFELVELLIRSWPDYFERFAMKGVLPSTSRNPTAQEVKQLRQGGIMNMAVIDGAVYMPPGRGLTTASTPTKVTAAAQEVHRIVYELERLVGATTGQFQRHVIEKEIRSPVFTLALTPRGLCIYEKKSDTGWLLTENSHGNTTKSEMLSRLCQLIAPEWLIQTIDNAQVSPVAAARSSSDSPH
jgi:hypothetical protein